MQYIKIYVIITIMKRNRMQRRLEEKNSERILGNLGLDWENLNGKSVLDIGAAEAEVARAGKRRGMNIISIDRNVRHLRQYLKQNLPKDLLYIFADAKHLPFPDESFDVIMAHASVPLILVRNRFEVESIISESYRVLKPNGEFHFGGGDTSTLPLEILDGGEVPTLFKRSIPQEQIFDAQQRTLCMLREICPHIERFQPSKRLRDHQQYFVLRKQPQEKQ
jgi:ubiquinone/menaquinone biosynthesis C-methylase UbiE